MLIYSGPVYETSSYSVIPDTKLMRRMYTFLDVSRQPVEMFTELPGGKLMVPRELCQQIGTDLRAPGADVNFDNFFVPRNNEQSRVVAESVALLKSGKSHIIKAPTAFGKTIVASAIISNIKKKALVIITKDDLASQWVDAFQKVLGLPPEKIGLIKGAKCRVSEYVDIAFIQTLCKDKEFKKLDLSQYGIVVVDEIHRLGAPEFQKAMFKLPAKLRLGLTATDYRSDKKDPVFFGHVGPVLVETQAATVPFRAFVYDTGITVPRDLKHTFANNRYLMSWLSRRRSRNALIAEKIISAYTKGYQCIVFSDFIDHLKELMSLTSYAIPPADRSMYVGGLSKAKRDDAKTKKVIFATYKMCSEGTDIPGAAVAILTMPRANIEQIIGRVLRMHVDKAEAFVIDFSDTGSPVLTAFQGKRVRLYEERATVVRHIGVSHAS